MTGVSSTGPDTRDGTGTAASSAAPGLSGSRTDIGESESGQDGSGELRARVDRRDELAYRIQRAVEGDPDVIRYDEDDWTRIADVVMAMIDDLVAAANRETAAQAQRRALTEVADFIERHVSQIGPASQTLAPGQSFAVKLLRDWAALRDGGQ